MIRAIQILIGGLLNGSVYAVVALGFSLIYRVTGVINLCQGAFCIFGALAMYGLHQFLGWPTALAAAGAVASTTVFGLALGAITFVPALAHLPSSSMLMVTAGLLTLIEGLILIVWGNQPYALPQFSGEAPVHLLGVSIVTQGFWIVGGLVCAALVLRYLLVYTSLGRALLACAENRTAARLMGISVPRMTLLSFGLAAMIAALGGVLVAPITSLQFDSGRFFTISGFIAVAIGGLGSFVGAVVGGLALGVAEQLAAGYVSSLFSNALALGLLLATLLWRPSGLFAQGLPRRQDVRDDQRVFRPIVRLRGKAAAMLGCIAVAVAAALPWFVGEGSLLPSLVITGILFLAVLGLDVLMGFTGQVSLGQAGFLAIGGYAAASLSVTYGLPPLAGVAAGMALSVLCACALSLVTMHLRGHYLALATLTFGLLVDALALNLTEVTGGPSGFVGIPSFSVGPVVFDTPRSMLWLVIGLLTALVLVLHGGLRSGFGRALQAVRTDQLAAAALGINVGRHRMAAFAISAALASLAGSLYAFFFHFLSPEMVGTSRSFEMISMLVIGGEGTLVGPLLGVALLTLLPEVFQPFALYKTFVQGAFLVFVFRFLPDGLFGGAVRGLRRVGGLLSSLSSPPEPKGEPL